MCFPNSSINLYESKRTNALNTTTANKDIMFCNFLKVLKTATQKGLKAENLCRTAFPTQCNSCILFTIVTFQPDLTSANAELTFSNKME